MAVILGRTQAGDAASRRGAGPSTPREVNPRPLTGGIGPRDKADRRQAPAERAGQKPEIHDSGAAPAPGPRTAPSELITYTLPPAGLLRPDPGPLVRARARDQLLASVSAVLKAFGIDATVTGVHRGPADIRCTIRLGAGVRVAEVMRLVPDFGYALGSAEVSLLPPGPGRPGLSIVIPHAQRDMTGLGDVLRSPAATTSRHPMLAGLGRDFEGRPVVANLAAMPHLLIGGTTGSGKSTCLHALIASVLMRATPAEVRMLLIDTRRVELAMYRGTPHLITDVIANPWKAADALQWTVDEIARRCDDLAASGSRTVDDFNKAIHSGRLTGVPTGTRRGAPFPYLLVIIDDLADLMATSAHETENAIAAITRLGRPAGVHLVAATQRTSVDVITGIIKANMPSRLVLAISSATDSRVILDRPGAEKLTAPGDSLFLPAAAAAPIRLQGASVAESEIRAIVAHCRRQVNPEHRVAVTPAAPACAPASSKVPREDLDLLARAAELVVGTQFGSTSMLQRKLGIGFARAGTLMDLMETRGIVGPSEGSRARDVLIDPDDLLALLDSLRAMDTPSVRRPGNGG